MIARRVIPAVLVAALALGLAAPAAGQRPLTRKQQANRLLAPLRQFERETRPDRPAVREALRVWQEETVPCLATAKQDLAAAPFASEEVTAVRVYVLYVHVLVDGYKRSFAPAQPAVRRAERRWRRMQLADRRLQLLAGWQADGLALARSTALPSTCALYAEWKATGFDVGKVPATTQRMLEDVENLDTDDVEAALRTLRSVLGVRLRDRFAQFPLAAPMVLGHELTAPLDRALA